MDGAWAGGGGYPVGGRTSSDDQSSRRVGTVALLFSSRECGGEWVGLQTAASVAYAKSKSKRANTRESLSLNSVNVATRRYRHCFYFEPERGTRV